MGGGVGRGQHAAAQIGSAGGDRLARRVDDDRVERAKGALAGRIERAHRLDLVAEQLDADRQAVQRREQIDDAAAHGEGARVLDHRRAAEAGREQRVDGLVAADDLAALELERERQQLAGRDHAAHKRRGGHDDGARRDRTAAGQAVERGHAAHQRAAIRRDLGVGRGARRRDAVGAGRRCRIAVGRVQPAARTCEGRGSGPGRGSRPARSRRDARPARRRAGGPPRTPPPAAIDRTPPPGRRLPRPPDRRAWRSPDDRRGRAPRHLVACTARKASLARGQAHRTMAGCCAARSRFCSPLSP